MFRFRQDVLLDDAAIRFDVEERRLAPAAGDFAPKDAAIGAVADQVIAGLGTDLRDAGLERAALAGLGDDAARIRLLILARV